MTDELPGNLDELLADDDSIDYELPPEPITDEQIDRRLASLARLRRHLADYDRRADALRAEAESRIERARRPLLEKIGWVERSLQLTHQALYAQDPRRTRISFANGTLASKAGGVEWVWPEAGSPEDMALLSWALDYLPDAVSYPPAPPARVARNDLKAAVKATTIGKGPDKAQAPLNEDGSVRTASGEVVPCVRVVAKPREFHPETAGFVEPPEIGF